RGMFKPAAGDPPLAYSSPEPVQTTGTVAAHDVMASQHGLDSLASDVAAVKACLARVSSPAILVGHSYGRTLIAHAGPDARVPAVVYIAALARDADETSQSLLDKFPTSAVFDHLDVPEGRAKPVRLCPGSSDVNLFSYREGIVQDAETVLAA